MLEPLPDRFEKLLIATAREKFEFTLFITGMSEQSVEAVRTVTRFCEEHLEGRYELEIIDVYLYPDRAAARQIVAAPTLLRRTPLPMSRLIGRLSTTTRIFEWLELWLKDTMEGRCQHEGA